MLPNLEITQCQIFKVQFLQLSFVVHFQQNYRPKGPPATKRFNLTSVHSLIIPLVFHGYFDFAIDEFDRMVFLLTNFDVHHFESR